MPFPYRCGVPLTATDSDGLPWTVRLWPDGTEGPWKVGMLWTEVDGRQECVEVKVSGAGSALPATILRQIPFGDFIAEERASRAPAVEATGGMRRSAVERLRVASEVYQRALREKRKPTKAVAEHFGISQGGASNLVARARAAGLLPPTSSGKAAG